MNKAKEITLVSIKDIKPNPKNNNKHGPDQIERLVKVIEYQGFRNPLIVSNRSGLLVAGHARLTAAKRLKLKEVPVIYQDFESAEQEYAAMTADNSLAMWSDLDLGQINEDLVDLGPDFNVDMLGIKNFWVEPADKPKADRKCPHCGESLSRGQE